MFQSKGVLVIDAAELDEDQVMEDCLEAGAEDFNLDDGVAEVLTSPAEFSAVRDALTQKGYSFVSAQVEQVPDTYTTLTDEESKLKMSRLLDALEDNDDIQEVWHNLENVDELE